MENQEKNSSTDNVEVTINGESVTSNAENMTEEKLAQLTENLSNGLQSAMSTLNGTLIKMVEELHTNLVSLQKSNPSEWMKNLPLSKTLTNVDLTRFVKNLPVFEISNNEGKVNFLLNNKRIFEMDLSKFQKPSE